MIINKITKYTIGVLVLFSLFGCKKFLNVEPIDSLSGNNFWRNKDDAETFTREVYRLFRSGVGIDRPVLLIGDFRNAPVLKTATFPNRNDISIIGRGDIRTLVNTVRPTPGTDAERFWTYNVEWDKVSDWTPIYRVIQSANILYDLVPKVAENDPSFSANEVKKYQAEAVFMRSMSYFILIRLFSDVPYYTNSYNQDALPRTSHVEVAKKCLADLAEVKDDLPWTYSDPANRGVRAMRGSALALMMHLNMWLAGFDKDNAMSYYTATDVLGDELYQEGAVVANAYELLPIERVAEVFNGRSREGLFEIPNNVNYGESYGNLRKTYFAHVLHAPYFLLNSTTTNLSELTYDPNYMKTIYPDGQEDGRIKSWFTDLKGENFMYSGTGAFTFFKFFNLALGSGNTAQSLGNYQIIFRLADAVLLQAEANANLGKDGKATELLNLIRGRAKAGLYPASNNYENNLSDAIYWERCKELMGEGHYYYDLVRTGKIYDPLYSSRAMSYAGFVAGGWTWPINPKAMNNNPYMTLNDYWK
ncbi:RagB/SusD family nutrient uptake outer membrane protein [Sphingobacterium sp. JUb56]|uniref:RagB/SusD family nutrient uptake outer membrane protein n=1 Tax=Sphingobacterium sp. JUb56 TaxID=2587145 RepID=UPI00182ACCF6|nr:RagB/SusD family nutrient uptake outer membrane protein [Sphingobacterium sp. JUb56]MBB2954279.1 hypothetical protein [Sphingobacterium sp. JUb56]